MENYSPEQRIASFIRFYHKEIKPLIKDGEKADAILEKLALEQMNNLRGAKSTDYPKTAFSKIHPAVYTLLWFCTGRIELFGDGKDEKLARENLKEYIQDLNLMLPIELQYGGVN